MTATKSTSRFIGILESVVQNRQKETEKVLGFCNTLVKHFIKVRDQRDNALAQINDLNSKLKASADALAQQKEINQRLDKDISVLVSAVELAAQEIAQSDSSMINRMLALGEELKVPGGGHLSNNDISPEPNLEVHKADQQSSSVVDLASKRTITESLGELERLLAKRSV